MLLPAPGHAAVLCTATVQLDCRHLYVCDMQGDWLVQSAAGSTVGRMVRPVIVRYILGHEALKLHLCCPLLLFVRRMNTDRLHTLQSMYSAQLMAPCTDHTSKMRRLMCLASYWMLAVAVTAFAGVIAFTYIF